MGAKENWQATLYEAACGWMETVKDIAKMQSSAIKVKVEDEGRRLILEVKPPKPEKKVLMKLRRKERKKIAMNKQVVHSA